MDLQRFGRIALFVNLALSVIFCWWALGIYSNRIDFEAEKKKRDDIISGLAKTLQPGEGQLQATRVLLNRVVSKRPQLQDWYAKQLEELRTGIGPVQAVVVVKGEVQLQPEGQPRLGPVVDSNNQPINVQGSLKVLVQKYGKTSDDIKKVRSDSKATIDEIAKQTALIGDGKEPAAGQQAGLRYQWAAWQLAEKRSLNEQEFVKPLLYNRLVELQILTKRNEALASRLKEVEGAAVTQKQ